MSNLNKSFFPDEKTLAEVREKLSDTKNSKFTQALSEDATEVERAKYKICQLIAQYQRELGLQQDDLAKIMDVDKARVSEIMRGKIKHFTLDRLIDYSERLMPEIKVQIRIAA